MHIALAVKVFNPFNDYYRALDQSPHPLQLLKQSSIKYRVHEVRDFLVLYRAPFRDDVIPDIKPFQLTFGIIAFTVFLFCGVLRLARYNITDMKGVYRGMPITLNGIIIPAIYFIGSIFYPLAYAKFFPYIYLLLGILMVSSLKVKKL